MYLVQIVIGNDMVLPHGFEAREDRGKEGERVRGQKGLKEGGGIDRVRGQEGQRGGGRDR